MGLPTWKVSDASGAIVCDNPVAFAHPKNMTLPKASVTFLYITAVLATS